MNMKKILFQTLAAAACLVACNRNVAVETIETGSLYLALSEETEFITVETKAGTDYTDFNNYDVVIDGPTKVTEKFSEFAGRVVELGSGNYAITVTSPDTEPAAFEQPIYKAYETFEIRAGEVTSLDLLCVPDNCKVTIELSENFMKELATYEVSINNGLGELVWVKDETRNDFAENKAGYFLTRGLEVKVQGHRAIDDTQATAVYYVKNPQPGEHHVIKLDAKVTGTIGGITIDVVTDFNEVQDDIFVDGLEDGYVDRPDFDGTEGEGGEDEEENNNSIVWEGNELFEPQIISPDSQIQMTITMPAGIETFIVEVSDNFKEAVSVITEGGVDYIDLINDPKIIAEFGGDKSALLTGDEIYHQTEIFFDLSSFVPILSSTAKGMTVDFILNATDVNGQQLLFMGDKPTVTMIIPE
jgi:hypothetical protein